MNAPIRPTTGGAAAPAAQPVRTRTPAAAGGRINPAAGRAVQPVAQQAQQPQATAPVRTRAAPIAAASRQVAAPVRSQAAAAAPDTGWMKTGAAAVQVAEQEVARQREQQQRRAAGLLMPFRYWLPVGETGEYVVLDAALGPCFYEHNLKNSRSGKHDIFEACPKEWEPCPLCDSDKDSYYVMMLTVVDLRGYTNRQGQQVAYSRKLLPVKAAQQGFFMRQLERHGTLRGLHILGARDSQQDPQIGKPEFVALHTEQEIMASFGHPAQMDPQNPQRVVKQANADCFPFNYGGLFRKPSAEDLRRRYGGAAPAGSAQDMADEWGTEGGAPVGAVDADGAPWNDAVGGVDLNEPGDDGLGADNPAAGAAA